VLTRYVKQAAPYAVKPEGYYDLDDDMEKGHGGDTLLALISKRMEAGDQLA
jgi:hypothetical protein